MEQRDVVGLDTPFSRAMREIEIPQRVEMHMLARDTAARLSRDSPVSGGGTACQAASFSGNAARMLARPTRYGQQRPNRSGDRGADSGRALRAEPAHQREQREHDAADEPVRHAKQ